MAQLTYPTTRRSAVPGTIEGEGLDFHVINPVAPMRAGIGVISTPSATPGQERRVGLFAGGGGSLYAITHWQHDIDNRALTGEDIWPTNHPAVVRRQGRVWVYIDQNVTPLSAVFVRHTVNGGNNVLGAFRADADTASAEAVTNARFIVGGSAGGSALLEIDFPSS